MNELVLRWASQNDWPNVLKLVNALLQELGEEGEEFESLHTSRLIQDWQTVGQQAATLLAQNNKGETIGILTLSESFAIYAGGFYGIINEMYILPNHRSSGIGTNMLKEAARFGRTKNWSRIDVTAPESERWANSKAFYEKNDFVFTGPKLKLLL